MGNTPERWSGDSPSGFPEDADVDLKDVGEMSLIIED